MAGKRIYVTIPERDWQLIRRLAMLQGWCQGRLARQWLLTRLYRELERDVELRAYDAQLAAEDREKVYRGWDR